EVDLEVTGHPLATLYVTSTAEDGAVFVYLEDVDPDGNIAHVTEGMLRILHRRLSPAPMPMAGVAFLMPGVPMIPTPGASFRMPGVPYRTFDRADAAPLNEGDVAELVFDLLPTSYLFERGHRIRVAIAGADKDHFALIPEGGPPTLQVFREANRASRITLPGVGL
ncbi:MAG: CocE/NonD family hydrolase, partial [bacterium]|nr:CocE/NonD family hydrolase [bacterium]